jgi:hypothetical protein
MNDTNQNCGCQGCAQDCNCGCQATPAAEAAAHAAACGCGERCDCNPCRCTEAGL